MPIPDLSGKVIVVTGATSGIGFETARVLAERGAHTVIVGRNEEKLETSLAKLKDQSGNSDIESLRCDFASQAQIRRAAEEFKKRLSRLDVLVNNAGAVFLSRAETEDGVERTLDVNHLGYFLFTVLLLDLLKASAPARIVNVASDAHEGASFNFADPGLQEGYAPMKAYGQSKLANLLFTYELAKRLEGSGVTANALHPGFVATNIGASNIPLVGGAVKRIINLFAPKTSKQGAETSIYLASSPEVAGVTGKYFVDCKAVPSSAASYDETAQRQLWALSETLSGLA